MAKKKKTASKKKKGGKKRKKLTSGVKPLAGGKGVPLG
jgi:hypothetical protein